MNPVGHELISSRICYRSGGSAEISATGIEGKQYDTELVHNTMSCGVQDLINSKHLVDEKLDNNQFFKTSGFFVV